MNAGSLRAQPRSPFSFQPLPRDLDHSPDLLVHICPRQSLPSPQRLPSPLCPVATTLLPSLLSHHRTSYSGCSHLNSSFAPELASLPNPLLTPRVAPCGLSPPSSLLSLYLPPGRHSACPPSPPASTPSRLLAHLSGPASLLKTGVPSRLSCRVPGSPPAWAQGSLHQAVPHLPSLLCTRSAPGSLPPQGLWGGPRALGPSAEGHFVLEPVNPPPVK